MTKQKGPQIYYPRRLVVGFFAFGVAVAEADEAVIEIFSFCLPFAFFVGAFQ